MTTTYFLTAALSLVQSFPLPVRVVRFVGTTRGSHLFRGDRLHGADRFLGETPQVLTAFLAHVLDVIDPVSDVTNHLLRGSGEGGK